MTTTNLFYHLTSNSGKTWLSLWQWGHLSQVASSSATSPVRASMSTTQAAWPCLATALFRRRKCVTVRKTASLSKVSGSVSHEICWTISRKDFRTKASPDPKSGWKKFRLRGSAASPTWLWARGRASGSFSIRPTGWFGSRDHCYKTFLPSTNAPLINASFCFIIRLIY